MLAKKGEPLYPERITGVSTIGRLMLEREKAQQAAAENPVPVTEAATPAQPAPAQPAPLPAETERERVENILSAPEAEGRTYLAWSFAAETDLHSVEAIAAMRLAPRWQSATEGELVERILAGMTLQERVAAAMETRVEAQRKARQAAQDAEEAAELEQMLASLRQRKGGA
jgi:hypothetical protein